jgi:hypothetical protein
MLATSLLLLRWKVRRVAKLIHGPMENEIQTLCLGPGLAQWYSAGQRAGVRVPVVAGNFSPHSQVQTGSGAHSASYSICIRGSFPGVRQRLGEANHSAPSSSEVNNAWSCTSTTPLRLHSVVLRQKI